VAIKGAAGAVLTPPYLEQSLTSLPSPASSCAIDPLAPRMIEGITNMTVLSYVHHLNANNFGAVADLFAVGGALQPPFQQPIVGRTAILRYLQTECRNLKLWPAQGLISYQDDELTRLRVTGIVQTPWYGDHTGLSMAWRFSLDAAHQIVFVAIDLMSSPQELLTMIR
jgi:hypothetical protein